MRRHFNRHTPSSAAGSSPVRPAGARPAWNSDFRSAIRPHRLLDLLASWTPLDDAAALPEVEDLPPQDQPAL